MNRWCGEIRALDTPQNLRAAHTEEERITINITGLSPADAEQTLARAFGPSLAVIKPTSNANQTIVRFKRSVDDERLDGVLRVLQESGATIKSVETQRATLLDVLERYEHSEP